MDEKIKNKVRELLFEDKIEKQLAGLLPGIKYMNSIRGFGTDKLWIYVWLYPQGKEQINHILKVLPPTEPSTLIGERTSNETTLDRPFRMNLDNSIREEREFNISYISGEFDVNIKLEPSSIAPFISPFSRKVTDCEEHHFPGQSREEIHRMNIPGWEFKTKQLNWYGGYKTLIDTDTIDKILEHLTGIHK